MPLSSYPHFSQYLQLQQLHQQRYSSRNLLPTTQNSDFGMNRSGTSCSEASTEDTSSPSPSPPLSITGNNYHHTSNPSENNQNSTKSTKSFTIDAILGIRDRDVDRDHVNHLPNNYHPRLGLNLTNSSTVETTNNYSNTTSSSSLELSTATATTRFSSSSSSRHLLGFQIPTDLRTSSDLSNFGNEINRRHLQNQISNYHNSNCNDLTGELSFLLLPSFF